MIVNLALAGIVSLALTYYFKLPTTQSVIVAISVFVVLYVAQNMGYKMVEGFTDDNTRYVHYGDTITLWTHKNKFIRVNGRKNIPKGENFIFTCNHESILDIPARNTTIVYGTGVNAPRATARIPYLSNSFFAFSTSDIIKF